MAGKSIIQTITCDLKAAKVVLMGVPDIPGTAGRLFTDLANCDVGAEMIIQNNMRGGLNDIGFLIRKEDLDKTIEVCRDFSRETRAQGVSFNTEIACVSVKLANPVSSVNDYCEASMFTMLAKDVFTALAQEEINIDMISSTALAVTCVVSSTRADDAVRALNERFAYSSGSGMIG